jgi:hypothetical protein
MLQHPGRLRTFRHTEGTLRLRSSLRFAARSQVAEYCRVWVSPGLWPNLFIGVTDPGGYSTEILVVVF